MQRMCGSSPPEHINVDLPWYVPDHRIQTESASCEALRVATHVRGVHCTKPELNEQTLFVALHTCAFRASRCTRSRGTSATEQMEWLERWRLIREHLVECHIALARTMTARLSSRHINRDDLESEALFALFRAIDRFNPWRGFRFSTYACNVIGRALVRRGRQEIRYRRLFPVQHDEGLERAEGLPDMDIGLYIERLRCVLDNDLAELTELETRILSQRFPPEPERQPTFQEIGDIIGMSKERTRQIHNIALAKLRITLAFDPVLG